MPEQQDPSTPPTPTMLTPEEQAALRALVRDTAQKAAPVLIPLLLKLVGIVFPQAAPWLLVAQVLFTKLGIMGAPLAGMGIEPSTTGAVMASASLAMLWSGLLTRFSGSTK